MKKIIVLLGIMGFTLAALAQQVEVDQANLKVNRKSQQFDQKINIYIKNIDGNKEVNIKLTEKNGGSARRGVDYIINPDYNDFKMTDHKEILISIMPDLNQKEAVTVVFTLEAKLEKTVFSIQTYTLTINPAETNSEKKFKIDSVELKLLTAGSLSFFGNAQFSKYVGQLDVRIPSLSGRFGVNAGLFTKNYYTDSVSTGIGSFNVSKPNDTIKYAAKTYNRFAKVEYQVFGAYANPTFRISGDKTDNVRFFIDASFEVLATTLKTSYNNYRLVDSVDHKYDSNITKDDVLDPKNPRIMPKTTSTSHFITGYFGLGPQLIFQQKNLLDLNLLCFVGYSVTSNENLSSIPNSFNDVFKNQKFYYLAKGVITERVTKLNGTIGVEVRGFFPHNTGIAAYLGFLVSPSDFFKK